MNLKTKLILVFSLLSTVILLISSVAGYLFSKDQFTKGIQNEMKATINSHSNKLDGWIISKEKMIEIVGSTAKNVVGDGEITVPLMAGYKTIDKELSDVYLGTIDGKMIDGSGWTPPADYDPRVRSWYKMGIEQGKLSVTDPYMDMVTKQMAVSVAIPLKNSSGQIRGILAGDILLQTLVDNVREININGQGYAFLLDSKGVILAHPDASFLSKNVFEEEKLKGIASTLKDILGKDEGFKSYNYDNKDRLLVYKKIPTTGWTLAISVPEDVIYQPLSYLKWLFAVILFVSILLVVVITLFVANRITKPMETLARQVQLVAAGDLTVKAEVSGKDEIATLAVGFNEMVSKLRQLILRVCSSAEQLAASAQQLTASAQQSSLAAHQVAGSITQVAQGTEMQLKAVNETSGVVQQMSNNIGNVSISVNQASEKSLQVAGAATEGGASVGKAISQMANIEQTVSISAQVVAKLGERSKEIGQIVDTISGIAGQTNLLALNAAIEAARAGEQGRGFAVVAEEVRKLAEQSQEAAKQISQLISQIQGDTDKAVTAMNDGTHEVKLGADVVNAAGKTFEEITGLVMQVSDQVKGILGDVHQMANGSQQIVSSIKDIDQMSKKTAEEAETVSAATEEQAASMQEIVTSSQSLAHMAEELQAAVNKFKV
jgi:methyl-accepting chemotaxis protein